MPDPEEVDFDENVGQGEYDSGPFCRHWGSPYDCDVPCDACGHVCSRHSPAGEGECQEDGCVCKEFQ